jgi:hypothetical protein
MEEIGVQGGEDPNAGECGEPGSPDRGWIEMHERSHGLLPFPGVESERQAFAGIRRRELSRTITPVGATCARRQEALSSRPFACDAEGR